MTFSKMGEMPQVDESALNPYADLEKFVREVNVTNVIIEKNAEFITHYWLIEFEGEPSMYCGTPKGFAKWEKEQVQ